MKLCLSLVNRCVFQCSECVDGFLGKPTEGHQCFRQMIVERDQCLDPSTQMNCHNDPTPLLWGRTVFFGVQPKYLNMDICITLNVTSGVLDMYFSLENTMSPCDEHRPHVPVRGCHPFQHHPTARGPARALTTHQARQRQHLGLDYTV